MAATELAVVPETDQTERVEMELTVGDSVVALSLSGVQIDCAQEIANAVVGALLNVTQRERRSAESDRVHPDRYGPAGAE